MEAAHMKGIERQLKERPVGTIGERRYFSVMILLVEREDGLAILFEQRSRRMKTQPGDVCFPGGRMEAGESPRECALRETWEEIGVSKEDIEVLGQFDTMYEIAQITMYTFVGRITEETLKKIRVNQAEVDRVFLVPWRFFHENPPQVYESQIVQKVEDFPYEETGIRSDYKWRTGKNPIPIYHYTLRSEDLVVKMDDEELGKQVIWGLTGRIVKWFIQQMSEPRVAP